MTNLELQELKTRVKYAVFHKFKIAKAQEYAQELEEDGASMTPPQGVKAFSAEHLLAMIQQVEGTFEGSKPSPAKPAASKPAPKTEAPKAEAKPAPEAKAAAKTEKAAAKAAPKAEAKAEAKAEVKAEAKVETKPATLPEPKEDEERPTVPVDIGAVHAAVQAMRAPKWEVVLTDVGNGRIALVKELREVLGSDLRAIEMLVDKVPGTLKGGMTKDEADTMAKRLQATGVTVEVREAS